MKFIKIFTLMAFLVCGALAQSKTNDSKSAKTKPLVVKTASVRSTALRSFTATAYSLRGRTASGEYVRQGIIAADPRVLPLGTRVYIEGMGEFVVKDTGGAIKGTRIDIWMPSKGNAMKFGRRNIKLRVL